MICISISDIKQLGPVLAEGAELIELRFDLMGLRASEFFSEIPAGVKTIATCREDVFTENERKKILIESIKLGANFVDIELEAELAYAREIQLVAEDSDCQVIFSHHDFKGTPDQEKLEGKLKSCFSRGGQIAKIATRVQSREDATKLIALHLLPGKKVILGMGPLGRITRVAAPLLGSEFTFASPGSGETTAPGQMSLKELNSIYKILKGS